MLNGLQKNNANGLLFEYDRRKKRKRLYNTNSFDNDNGWRKKMQLMERRNLMQKCKNSFLNLKNSTFLNFITLIFNFITLFNLTW